MLLEGVFVDVESKLLIEVFEEDATHVVTLADDDGVLFRELLEIGKRRTKHGVRRNVTHARRFVKIFHISLYAGNIADDALLGQIWNDLFKYRDGVLQRDGIDKQFGLEGLNLLVGRKALTIIREAHAFGIALEDSHLVVETQQVDEERAHLACPHY